MNKVTALVGMTVLALMAGCARKESPQAPEKDVGAVAVEPAPAAAQPEAAPPTAMIDRTKEAAGMVALIDPSPRCQQYRDELQAKGSIPGSVDELSEIFAQAFKAGCGKKRQQ